ncbi:restriction endonuclease subunit S [Riemerella anatipestifer]|uniref:restriction endonuclease subunit S n=1 Tax=Riemerella anatipestifer TaxID=34085 RepID=UPI0030BB688C
MSYLDKLLQGTEVEWKTLGEVAEIGTGSSNRQDEDENGIYPFYVRSKNILSANSYEFDEIAVIVPGEGGIGDIFHYVEGKYALHQRAYRIHIIDNVIIGKFFYYVMTCHFKKYILSKSVGSTSVSIRKPMLEKFSIPIPPLSVQEEIVRILDKFTALEAELEAELDCRKRQYEYYRDHLLTVNEQGLMNNQKVEWKTLGEVVGYEQPTKYIVKSNIYSNHFSIPVLTAGKTFILGYTDETIGVYKASNKPVIIFDDFTTANKWVDFDFKVKSSAMKMITSKDESKTLLKYIYYYLNTLPSGLTEGDHKRQWISNYSNKKIPVPPIEEQERIVAILDKFDTLAHSISEGLPKEIELRKKQYEYYRDQLLSFSKNEIN